MKSWLHRRTGKISDSSFILELMLIHLSTTVIYRYSKLNSREQEDLQPQVRLVEHISRIKNYESDRYACSRTVERKRL